MLKALNLRKHFAAVCAVHDVSFDVNRGEIFGLLGPNGAGKTTSIRLILNILQADAGEVRYDDHPFSEQIRNQVGYLPEERGLYRKSKVIDTILYFAGLRGMDVSDARRKALEWLERFRILEYKDRRTEELSKGNQQKVQFIATILHDPTLIVLDEPFSGLDPVNQILFKEVFREFKQQNKAVIYSTHQMDQAEKLSDTLCLINQGRVILSGSVREVKRKYGRNAVYLEYEGNGNFLGTLPGVSRAHVLENSAELDLSDGATMNSILPLLSDKLELRKIELREPSLESIFLQEVGHSDSVVPPKKASVEQ